MPIQRIVELPEEKVRRLRKQYWPAAGIDTALVSCAWLLREIESSTARLGDITFHRESARGITGNCGWAEWRLPVSKTDQKGDGTVRSLACACPSTMCPVAALRRVAKWAKSVRSWPPGPQGQTPLIVRRDGHPMSKKDVTRFYRDVSGAVGVDISTITGHSARVTGAMRMALGGYTEWVIQLFGRWSSATVLKYVRSALLGEMGGNIAQLTEGNHHRHKRPEVSMSVVRHRIKESYGNKGVAKTKSRRHSAAIKEITVDKLAARMLPELVKVAEGAGRQVATVISDEDLGQMIDVRVEEVVQIVRAYLSMETRYLQSYSGTKHISLLDGTALCGWPLEDDKVRVIREGPGGVPSKAWCQKCVSRHKRLTSEDG